MTLDLEITSLAFGGDGVARHEGRVVFVPFTVPGERVRVRIVREEKKLLRGEVEAVFTASPAREVPPCPVYGTCGGCQYQHLNYDLEVEWKERQVRETLQRLGRILEPRVEPILRSPEPYGYRNRITVHYRDGQLGFLGRDGRSLVEIRECALAEDAVNAALRRLRHHPPPRERWTLRGPGVEGHAFYQANRFLLDALRARITAALVVPGETAPALVEGYAGVGFFTEVLAPHFETTVAIEREARAAAVGAAKRLPGTMFLTGDCAQRFPEAWEKAGARPGTAVLVDPPRTGLEPGMADHLNRLPFGRLAYLSCNPATLARDAAALSSHWSPERFEPVDLFPRTAHIECLAVFVRKLG